MNKKAIIIFASFLAAFVVTILLIVFIIPSFKNEDILIKYYNEKVASYEIENKSLSNVDVAFIGDSITDGYDIKTYYPQLNAVNRGIGGDTTTGVLNRLKVSLYDISPKVIVMCIGGNNLDSMMENYDDILQGIKDNLPNSKVIVCSLYPTAYLFSDRNEQILSINAELKTLTQSFNYAYYDMYSIMVDGETKQFDLDYTSDGLHPNKLAYEKITEALTPVITSLLTD